MPNPGERPASRTPNGAVRALVAPGLAILAAVAILVGLFSLA